MKYCKRCFRNIFEDTAVCPYCGRSDKLMDYEKEKNSSGEDFSCNNDSTVSSHIKTDDAYSIGNKSADDVYGNSSRHDIDNCENRSEAPQKNTQKRDLSSLSPEERRRLYEQKRAELNRRLAAENNGRYPTNTAPKTEQQPVTVNKGCLFVIMIIIFMVCPILLPIAFIIWIQYKAAKNKK